MRAGNFFQLFRSAALGATAVGESLRREKADGRTRAGSEVGVGSGEVLARVGCALQGGHCGGHGRDGTQADDGGRVGAAAVEGPHGDEGWEAVQFAVYRADLLTNL